MLKVFTREYINASFETLRRVEIFGVQVIERTIALTETSYGEGFFKYFEKAVRTARIPIEYIERYNWRVFELLAYLLVKLKEQVHVHETLNKEQPVLL